MSTKTTNKTDRDIELEDLLILDECLACARLMMKAHIGEEKQRNKLIEKGEELPKRWQISPAVVRGLLTIVPKLQGYRRMLRKIPAMVENVSKKVIQQAVKLTNINDMFQAKPNVSLT